MYVLILKTMASVFYVPIYYINQNLNLDKNTILSIFESNMTRLWKKRVLLQCLVYHRTVNFIDIFFNLKFFAGNSTVCIIIL